MTLDLQIQPLNTWLPVSNGPMIISGPCSVESEEQVLATAKELAQAGRISMLRGGIWKPRTRPNAFEGVGAKGLPWLKKAGEATGLLTATEVARAEHVEAALKAGIDVLWIGARTTVNPFSFRRLQTRYKGWTYRCSSKTPSAQTWRFGLAHWSG